LTFITDYVVYSWKSPSGPYGIQDPGVVFKDNLGYWVWIDQNYLVHTTGVAPANRNIQLSVGWNLVGFPVVDNNTTPDYVFTGLTYPDDYSIYYWTAPSGPYVLQDSNMVLDNNLGYWVWIDQDKIVTVP
jgi:hypothetical protein